MYAIFMDESGYSFSWQKDMNNQPYFVQSAVCFPLNRLEEAYNHVRLKLGDIRLPESAGKLGRGFELKAKDIARGYGWWGDKPEEREVVRNLMLELPALFAGRAFLLVIDKHELLTKYGEKARDPQVVAFQYTLERIQWLLEREEQYAICIYDQNKKIDDIIHGGAASLAFKGSQVFYFSKSYGQFVSYSHKVKRVVEMTLGNSKNSLGLQVADFYATMAYQYFKAGRPSECGWWKVLQTSLDRKDGNPQGILLGYGLKVFPDSGKVSTAYIFEA
jgi:hypothetical protein